MSRRVSMPTADDLFRPTDATATEDAPAADEVEDAVDLGSRTGRAVRVVPTAEEGRSRRPSGRVRHDEKMTVYVTADELLDLDSARLSLRREHGLAVDRGRIVREAIALVLADLEEHGYDSPLVQRLVEE